MSKFIDKLTNLNKSTAPAMGFGRADATAKQACMLVMVELAGKTEDEIKGLAGAGIAAGLIDTSGLTAAALAKLIKSRGELNVGIVLANGKSASQKAANGDIDFIVFEPSLPLKVFEGRDLEETGKVIRLEMSADAGLLRSVNNLYPGVDAVLVDLSVSSLTVENMMACRRVSDFSGQPVIARVATALSTAELSALREAGVKVLLLKSDAGADDVKALLEAIAALPKPDKKKGPKGVALVPSVGMGFGTKKEDDDGGDDGGDDDDD
jgi:DNA-binding NarL/FixJ family response regulator